MSNVQSYNALIDRFKAFASGHFILKTFSHGQIDTADLEKFTEYPFMHVVPSNVTYAKGTKTFSFQIVLADLPRDKDDKVEFQREVLSDLQRIAEDLVAEITNHRVLFGDLITVQNVTLEPFLEEFHNTLTGWTVSLELLVPYYWDACSIPAEWNDMWESSTGGTGSILTFIDSITRDENGNVSLVNDEGTPAPNYYYGTNDEGVRGWYFLADEVGLTCATIGSCQTIIDIESAIDALQIQVGALETDVALKANTADISAVGFSNDYNDLDNKPTIPTATSDLTNDSGFITIGDVPAQVNADWNSTTGASEILNKPTIPAAQIQSDWNQTNNVLLDFIKNKPTIPTSLPPTGTAGGDLTGTYPDPTVHRIHGIDMQNGTPTANDTWVYGGSPAKWQHQHLNASQVDNDSSVTGATVKLALEHLDSTKQATLVSGTNIKTVNSNSLLGAGNISVGTVTSVAALTLGTTGTDLSSSVANSTSTPVITLNVPTASATNRGALSSTDWATFNAKQGALTLTTTGTSGASTLIGNTLNIPQYAGTNIYNADGSLTAARTLTLNTFALTILGTTSSRFFANGNVAIGTTTDAGFKLDVNGTARVSGNVTINTNGSAVLFSSRISTGSNGANVFIGGGGQSVTGTGNQGSYNTSIGVESLQNITTGQENVGLGWYAGRGISSGVQNVLIGRAAGYQITTGVHNTGVGAQALFANITGGSNTAFGYFALGSATTSNNTAIGWGAGWNSGTNANTTGQNNIFVGYNAIGVSATESNRTWIGNASTTTTWLGGSLLIGTTTDAASSICTIESTAKGFLPPRMTTTQKNAIASPAAGLMVYDTTLNLMSVYNGTTWITL